MFSGVALAQSNIKSVQNFTLSPLMEYLVIDNLQMTLKGVKTMKLIRVKLRRYEKLKIT